MDLDIIKRWITTLFNPTGSERRERLSRIALFLGILGMFLIGLSECGKDAPPANEVRSTDSYAALAAAESLEQQLLRILEHMDGVGSVKIMITMEDSGESYYATEDKTDGSSESIFSSNGNFTVIVGLVAPDAVALIGFLMFGNLIRECGVMNSISETAQNALANLITIFLGITIASQMKAADFLQVDTLIIIGLGLVAFVFDTFGGIMVAKVMNLFSKEKINPMIGAAGISAFPMSARVVHKLGLAEDNQNFLLMHSIGVNVSGQIASVIAGGLILALVKAMIGG